MAELKDIVAYILQKSPNKDDMSKARLTKMVYLSDWRAALALGHQLTSINWLFDHNGPFVYDVIDMARHDKDFVIEHTTNYYGSNKTVISMNPARFYEPRLKESEREVIDHVISKTSDKSFKSFISLVYSTCPIRTQERYKHLDLVGLAQKYGQEREKRPSSN